MSQQQVRPLFLFCAAALADEALLAQWERQLLPLQQAGLVTLWSERHLSAGDTREQNIREQFSQADVIILLLSADFFASLECVSLMGQALKRQQDEGTKVIPLLLRACAWQESPLGTLACLPPNETPVTEWANQDKALHACVQGVCQLLGLPTHLASPPLHTLRVFLARTSGFPWKAIPFLEDATARILLRRVGGGYSFLHRRLLDYFADAYPSEVLEVAASKRDGIKRDCKKGRRRQGSVATRGRQRGEAL